MKNATKNNRNDFNFKETFNEFLENIQTKRDSEGRIPFKDAKTLVSIGLKYQYYFGVEGEFVFTYHEEYGAWLKDDYNVVVEKVRYSSYKEICYILAKMQECIRG